MKRSASGLATLACLLFVLATGAAAGPELFLVSSSPSETLPQAQPDWPTPSDDGMVFYLQRSISKNAVVYAAQYEESGDLEKRKPLHAFWRRYSDDGPGKGAAKPLKFLESFLAYGVKTIATETTGEFNVRFAALPELTLTLRQESHNHASLWAEIENQDYRLVYGYVEIDQKALIPKVDRLRLYTTDAKTGNYVTHIISVTGGAIPE